MADYTVNGSPVQSIVVKLPRRGIWTARCKLAGNKVLAARSPVVIQLGDLTLSGVVRQGGVFVESAEYVIVGGSDGWARPVAPRPHRSDAGVKLSRVALDLARDAGERLELVPGADRVLGYAWPQFAGAASENLDALGSPWWLAPSGVTYVGERPVVELPKVVKWTLSSFDPALRLAVVAPGNDMLAAFQPGLHLAANGMDIVAGSVVMTVNDRKASIEIWGV
ncbi:MAG: hypothetical protein ACMG6S_20585 [Byssovorax sp.]